VGNEACWGARNFGPDKADRIGVDAADAARKAMKLLGEG